MHSCRKLVCYKKKKAYEMRSSDWSAEVCSSDVVRAVHHETVPALVRRHLQPDARRIDVVAAERTIDAARPVIGATHAVEAVEPAETAPGTIAARPVIFDRDPRQIGRAHV